MIRSGLSRARGMIAASVASAVIFGLAGTAMSAAGAESGALVGTWSGTGSIAFASGSKEKARCRARFAKTGEISYEMTATCATSSAKVDQTATLIKTGANTYAGSFFNQQYNTGGSIRITVSGRTQHVRISGEAGTAVFSMRKL